MCATCAASSSSRGRGAAARGVFLNHDASRTTNDCYVCEIPPAGKLAPHRQMFEEMVFVLDGRGSTTVWNDAGQRVTFEWKAGAIFGIPLNCWHQHFNGSGQAPARYVAVTNAPQVINLYEDIDFVFNSKRDFKNRFSGEPDYFAAGKEREEWTLNTNFIADAVNLPLAIAERARRRRRAHPLQSRQGFARRGHISQFPVATYKKAHAHGPGAHVIILVAKAIRWSGTTSHGEPIRYDWEVGTLLVPPNAIYHQHFNTGATPGALSRFQARRLAAQFARRAVVLHQPAAGRRPARLCRRGSGGADDVRRGARAPRPDAADGGILPQRAGDAAAERRREG